MMASITSVLGPEGVKGDDGEDGLQIEVVWDSAPFNKIFTVVDFQSELYAAGRYDERIFRSPDGRNWSPAFSNRTTYAWFSSTVFNDELYFVSSEDNGGSWSIVIWRSSDGIMLEEIFEATYESFVHPSNFGIFNGSIFLGIKDAGAIIRSHDGENWEEVYFSDTYSRFKDFIEYDGIFYVGGYSRTSGGALLRTLDGENWSTALQIDNGTDNWHSAISTLVVFEDELYFAMNDNMDTKWVSVHRSSDGEHFEEVWYTDEEGLNAPKLVEYDKKLFLIMSGTGSSSLGGAIYYQDRDQDRFTLLMDGDDDSEHTFSGISVFKNSLYVGGGSSHANKDDAFVYRIYFSKIAEPNIEIATENLPFGTVFVLTEFNGHLYTAGRWNERIYRSPDGDNWVLAFPNTTTYAWQNGITFNNSLYLVSCEGSGDKRTTVLWRSSDGVSLDRIFEIENTTTERPAFGIFNGTLFMGVEAYLENNITGCLYRSRDGEGWDRIFTTSEGRRFQVFTIFNEAMYFTMSGLYCGGTLFRTYDGDNFEKTSKWNESLGYGEDGAYGLCVFEDELYVALNYDGGSKYIRVLKSTDGETFEDIWYSTDERTNAAKLCVYKDRLYLYICGKEKYSVGTQIRYFTEDKGESRGGSRGESKGESRGESRGENKGEFKLLHEGDPAKEHSLLRHAVFKDALYIGGGSGNWMSHDAIIYRISDPKPLTLRTSGSEYFQGDNITITASFVSDVNITYQIMDSSYGLYLLETKPTDAHGIALLEFQLHPDDPTGSWTVFASNDRDYQTATLIFTVTEKSISQFQDRISILALNIAGSWERGTNVTVQVRILSTFASDRSILVALQMKDSDNRCLAPVVLQGRAPANSTGTFNMQIPIPLTSPQGNHSLQGQILTGFPENGGYILDFKTTGVVVS